MKVRLPDSTLAVNGQHTVLKDNTAYIFFPQMGNGRTTVCLITADPECERVVASARATRYVHDNTSPDLGRRYAMEKAIKSFEKPVRAAIWQKYLTVYPPNSPMANR